MRRAVALTFVIALMLAVADPLSAQGASKASGPSPFPPEGCGQLEEGPRQLGDGNPHGAEMDLSVVSNPADSDHVVAAWVQDAGMGIVVATSFDGGNGWQRTVVAGMSRCTGGRYDRILHARLAFGGDGTLWLAGEGLDAFFPDPRSGLNGIPVSTSRDGGLTWSAPVYVNDDGPMNGFNVIAGHPTEPMTAAVVWHTPEPVAQTFVSTSTDGGATWTARPVPGDALNEGLPSSRIVIAPDGTYHLFRLTSGLANFVGVGAPQRIELLRSTDQGQTWAPPVTLATDVDLQWPNAVVGPDGVLSVGWLKGDSMYVRSSSDGGDSWSEPALAATGILKPQPTLGVDGAGNLGLGYLASAGGGLQELRAATSGDRGLTWDVDVVDGPFAEPGDVMGVFAGADGGMADGPKEAGYYMETAGLSVGGFVTIYQRGGDTDGPSDAYVVTYRDTAATAGRG